MVRKGRQEKGKTEGHGGGFQEKWRKEDVEPYRSSEQYVSEDTEATRVLASMAHDSEFMDVWTNVNLFKVKSGDSHFRAATRARTPSPGRRSRPATAMDIAGEGTWHMRRSWARPNSSNPDAGGQWLFGTSMGKGGAWEGSIADYEKRDREIHSSEWARQKSPLNLVTRTYCQSQHLDLLPSRNERVVPPLGPVPRGGNRPSTGTSTRPYRQHCSMLPATSCPNRSPALLRPSQPPPQANGWAGFEPLPRHLRAKTSGSNFSSWHEVPLGIPGNGGGKAQKDVCKPICSALQPNFKSAHLTRG